MHAFRFGPKAIQDINRFQAILARYSRSERLSIVRFLSQSVVLPVGTARLTTVAGNATKKTWSRSSGKVATRRKLSRVASARKRTANGTFAPVRGRARAA